MSTKELNWKTNKFLFLLGKTADLSPKPSFYNVAIHD